MSSIVDLIRDLLVFIVAMFALLIVLLVVVARMPDDNPLKRVLNALGYRLGATLGASVLAIPIEPIPGLDVLYDIGAPIFLLYYWFTFLRDAVPALRAPALRGQGRRHFH